MILCISIGKLRFYIHFLNFNFVKSESRHFKTHFAGQSFVLLQSAYLLYLYMTAIVLSLCVYYIFSSLVSLLDGHGLPSICRPNLSKIV